MREDDALALTEDMRSADVIVFVTPFDERADENAAGPCKFALWIGVCIPIYMLSTAAEDAPEVPQKAVSGLVG